MRLPCADQPELHFPIRESVLVRHGPTAGERRALVVCAGCPALAACRAYSLEVDLPYGVAGGMTAAERRAERATRRRAVTA